MNARLYRLNRTLHLYLGLFISPFVLVFAITVFFFAHSWLPRFGPETSTTRTIAAFPLPEGWPSLSGGLLIDALKPALATAGVRGEVGFVRHMIKEGQLIIPVTIPGRETMVTINLATRQASVVTRERGLADALMTLHKSPGPHGPGIRMNWPFMKAWQWAADATVYLVLVVSLTGFCLWHALRAERTVGRVLLVAGAVIFFGIAYALSH